jgi:hypothetical protein
MSLSQDGRNNLILLVVVNFERLPSLTLETLLIDTIAQITTKKKKKTVLRYKKFSQNSGIVF